MQKTILFWIKLNELFENVSFDSEFILAFDIQPFKVAFFFLNANFSKYFRAEWVKKHSREMSFFSVNTNDRLSRSSRPTLLKKRLCRRYFPVNFTKFLRTSFLQNTSSGFFWLKILLSTHRALGRHSEGTWALREH